VLEDLHDAGAPARAGRVAQLLRRQLISQGVAVDVFDRLATSLTAHWARYAELVISDDGSTLALITRGRGAEFLVRLTAALACCDIEPRAAARMLSLAEAGGSRQHWLELAFTRTGDPRPEISLMQRRVLSAAHGVQLLTLEPAAREQVHDCATLLGHSCIHGVALTARPDSVQLRAAVRFAQTLTARRREAVRMRLAHVLSRHAPCAAAVSCWAEHHDRWITHEHTPLSLWLTPATEASEVRIEYPDVSVAAAAGWLEERSSEVSERFAALCAAAGRSGLSHLEVSLQQACVPRLYAAVRVDS